MSIIIIVFPGAPKPTQEAIEEDRRLEEHIENIIREELMCSDINEYVDLLDALNLREIEGLPPGGGLQSKYEIIEKTFKERRPDLADQCEVRNFLYQFQ